MVSHSLSFFRFRNGRIEAAAKPALNAARISVCALFKIKRRYTQAREF
jgi:hypothetical protein